MKTLSLEEIRKSQIETMCILRDFCKKNNLRYYLTFGTLLGAVRHKGFIPWDDDVDIFMPRNGYDYLIKHFNDNNINNREVLAKEITPEHIYNFAKIVDRNTVLIEKGQTNKIGVWIDIFPLENIRYCVFTIFVIRFLGLLKRYASIKLEKERPAYKTFIIKVIQHILPSKEKLTSRRDHIIKSIVSSKETNTYSVLYRDFGMFGIPIAPRTMFDPPCKLEFEGEIFDVLDFERSSQLY